MYTILEKNTGKVLYVKFEDIVSDDQVAITQLRTIAMQNPHWDFENQIFYDKVEPETPQP
jgi:hypothetical protein